MFDDNSDSDFESLFRSMSDYDDESVGSDVEREVAAFRAKVKGKGVASPEKGKPKGVMLKKPVAKVTGKRKI